MRARIQARTREPLGRIEQQADRMPDYVQRLRYLRGRICLAPSTPRPWKQQALAALGVLLLIATAILIWRAT